MCLCVCVCGCYVDVTNRKLRYNLVTLSDRTTGASKIKKRAVEPSGLENNIFCQRHQPSHISHHRPPAPPAPSSATHVNATWRTHSSSYDACLLFHVDCDREWARDKVEYRKWKSFISVRGGQLQRLNYRWVDRVWQTAQMPPRPQGDCSNKRTLSTIFNIVISYRMHCVRHNRWAPAPYFSGRKESAKKKLIKSLTTIFERIQYGTQFTDGADYLSKWSFQKSRIGNSWLNWFDGRWYVA